MFPGFTPTEMETVPLIVVAHSDSPARPCLAFALHYLPAFIPSLVPREYVTFSMPKGTWSFGGSKGQTQKRGQMTI